MSAQIPQNAARSDRPWVARAATRVLDTIDRLRRRWPWFDHLARAGGRYSRMQSDLMAAGITYFAFLSLFPVVLLIASIVGLVLAGNELLEQQLVEAIQEAVPGQPGDFLVEQVRGAISSSGFVGVLALLGFVYAGLRTMDKLRIGVRRVWTGRAVEPDFLQDNLRDVVSFAALGVAGLLSVALTGGATTATSWLLGLVGLDDVPGFFLLTTVVGITLALAGDTVVFLWLLKVVTHTSVGVRRLLPGAVFGAVGFEILKVLGTFYLSLISGSVTASTFGGAVGILIWINLVARYALFTTAWTATLPGVAPQIRAVVEAKEDAAAS
jgi:membrane protein